MLHADDSDFNEQKRSLLALGDALRAEAAKDSKLSRAIEEVRAEREATTIHRLARSRRNAREAPLMGALKDMPLRANPPEMPEARRVAQPAAMPQREASRRPEARETVVEEPAETPVAFTVQSKPADPQPERIQQTPTPDREESMAPRNAPPTVTAAPEAAVSAAAPVERPVVVVPTAAPRWDVNDTRQRRGARTSDLEGQWRPLIDPSQVVSGIVRSKWIILATTVMGAALGVMIALGTPKKYEATAELLADPRDLALVDRELTQPGISNEATLAIVDNQVRILTSGSVIGKVVENLNLAADPEFNGQGSGFGIRGLISSVRNVFSARDGEDDPGRRYALASMSLLESMSVERGGKTFVIGIHVTTRSPDKSALIANAMTDAFLQTFGELQSSSAGRAAGELTSRLDELRKGVEAAERKVEQFKAENDLVNAQGRPITDDEILKLNDQLSISRARTLELNARAASTRAVSADSVLGGVLPEELSSPGMQELRAQYSALKGEADRLSARLGPRHPQSIALASQLSGSRALIESEIRRIVSATQTELKRAVQLEQELSSRLAQLKVRQGGVSNDLVTLRELEREATAKRAVYESFLLRARETGEQQGINSANISVISKATPPLEASGPSRSAIALAGTMLGFLAGLGIGGARGTLTSLGDRARSGVRAPVLARRRRGAVTMFDSDEQPDLSEEDDSLPPDAAKPNRPDEMPARAAPPAASDTGTPEPFQPTKTSAAPKPASRIVDAPTAVSDSGTPNPSQPTKTSAAPEPVSKIADALKEPRDNTMYHPFQTPPMPFDPMQQPGAAGPTYAAGPSYAPPAGAPFQHLVAQAPYPPQPIYSPPPMPSPQVYCYPPSAGYPQAAPGPYVQPAPHGYWQQPAHTPMPGYPPAMAPAPYPYPYQQAPYPQPAPPQPAPRMAQTLQETPADSQSPIEEIRSSLREFRDAIRDLTESRSRRRYF